MRATVCFLLFAIAGASAQAGVVDFQDVESGSCAGPSTQIQSRGFIFNGNPVDPSLFICGAFLLQSNPTDALINANSRSIVRMEAFDGSTFSLISFFAGGRAGSDPSLPVVTYTVATGIEVTGVLPNGLSVSTMVPLDAIAPYGWSAHVLPPSFSNIRTAFFSAQGDGATPEFLIDDIAVNSAVPEPGIALLMLTGLIVCVARVSRRRRS